MSVRTFRKAPNEVLDYTHNWEQLASGETIVLSTWTIVKEQGTMGAGDLNKDSDTNSDNAATIWLSAGNAATNYTVVNRITTSAGRTYERAAFRILCKAPASE